MHSYLVLVIYWILSVLSTYIVRYYNNKKHAYRKIFAEEVPLSKKILENLAIWLIMPLAMPFVRIPDDIRSPFPVISVHTVDG